MELSKEMKRASRGGKRKGAGRPAIGAARRIDRSVSLQRIVWAFHRRDTPEVSAARSIETMTLTSAAFRKWVNQGAEE